MEESKQSILWLYLLHVNSTKNSRNFFHYLKTYPIQQKASHVIGN